MSKQPKSPKSPKSPVNELQRGEVRWVKRSQVKEAEYNPRTISDAAFDRLFKSLSQHGVVADPTWNERTGNLVGGHQRLRVMDKQAGYPKKVQDYDVRVLAIDVDLEEEKRLNVILNNPSAQGEWDLDKLAELSLVDGLDFEGDMLFSKSDIDFMFEGNSKFSELIHDIKDVQEAKSEIDEVKKAKEEAKEKFEDKFLGIYHFTVVCESHQEKENLLRALGVPVYEQFVGSHVIERSLNEQAKAALDEGQEKNPTTEQLPPSHDEALMAQEMNGDGGAQA